MHRETILIQIIQAFLYVASGNEEVKLCRYADLVILLDSSTSIASTVPKLRTAWQFDAATGEREPEVIDQADMRTHELMVSFVKKLAGRRKFAPDKSNLAIIKFASDTVVLSSLLEREPLRGKNFSLLFGNTHTHKAIERAALDLERLEMYDRNRRDMENFMLLLTDGRSWDRDAKALTSQVEKALQTNRQTFSRVTFIPIAVGIGAKIVKDKRVNDTIYRELQTIAGSGKVYYLQQDNLAALVEKLDKKMVSACAVESCPSISVSHLSVVISKVATNNQIYKSIQSGMKSVFNDALGENSKMLTSLTTFGHDEMVLYNFMNETKKHFAVEMDRLDGNENNEKGKTIIDVMESAVDRYRSLNLHPRQAFAVLLVVTSVPPLEMDTWKVSLKKVMEKANECGMLISFVIPEQQNKDEMKRLRQLFQNDHPQEDMFSVAILEDVEWLRIREQAKWHRNLICTFSGDDSLDKAEGDEPGIDDESQQPNAKRRKPPPWMTNVMLLVMIIFLTACLIGINLIFWKYIH